MLFIDVMLFGDVMLFIDCEFVNTVIWNRWRIPKGILPGYRQSALEQKKEAADWYRNTELKIVYNNGK